MDILELHFKRLQKEYGKIEILNLIKKSKSSTE